MKIEEKYIKSYWSQLEELAEEYDKKLVKEFIAAGVAEGTFYRNKFGRNELKHATAEKVASQIKDE